jgi:hypothetical protein
MGFMQAVVRTQVSRRGDQAGWSAGTDHPIVPSKRLTHFDATLQIDLAIPVQRHIPSELGDVGRAEERPHFAATLGNHRGKFALLGATPNHGCPLGLDSIDVDDVFHLVSLQDIPNVTLRGVWLGHQRKAIRIRKATRTQLGSLTSVVNHYHESE